MAQNISKNFSFVGQNIRKIRQAKKISQAKFAQLFNLARPSVGAYEEGRSEPKIDTLIQIAKHFGISIDVLLTRELTVSDIYSFDLVREKLDKAHKIEVKSTLHSVPVIRNTHYLDYIVNRQNRDYLKTLERIGIPDLVKDGLAFEVLGGEMEFQQQGLHHGDILIGAPLQKKNLKSKKGSIVAVVHKANISIKRLDQIDKKEITLSTDNPNYPAQSISISDIHEYWEIVSVYSHQLNAPVRLEERILKLEEALKSLKPDS